MMKGKLEVILLCILAVTFLIGGLANNADACANEPTWDKNGDFLISGSVGIGTKYPGDALHIFNNDPAITIDFGWNPTVDEAQMIFSDKGNPGARLYWSRSTDKIYLQNLIPTGGGPSLVLDNAGNVGIGTDNPQELLHVAGNVQVDGNIGAKYQDLAEWVMTSETLTTGTVVMIDTEKVDHVTVSDRAYNTLVAGVVSETPGIILGEESGDKAIIAHTGRVKVKVDTNYGAISTGDLLVTSPTNGYAMKADTESLKPGMLLGKALQSLEQGQQGEILVLVTLQ